MTEISLFKSFEKFINVAVGSAPYDNINIIGVVGLESLTNCSIVVVGVVS